MGYVRELNVEDDRDGKYFPRGLHTGTRTGWKEMFIILEGMNLEEWRCVNLIKLSY